MRSNRKQRPLSVSLRPGAVACLLVAVAAAVAAGSPGSPPAGPVITISPAAPADIPGGAAKADLTQAAAFAWQEFIALNWPAVAQDGRRGERGTANAQLRFGAPGATGPLVWETFRSKVEIFPGSGPYPPGYNPAVAQNGKYFGFDALPVYNYLQPVPACPGETGTSTPWINLDEVTQITLDDMSAGVVAGSSPVNSTPQLIRFLAKGNRTQYDYIAAKQYWNFGGNFYTAVQTFLNAVQRNQVALPERVVTFPTGTIETKAAWRMLTAGDDPAHFHTATVRYYENLPSTGGGPTPAPCYRQATWGLIALHIIQKTPTAPSFIFASFEQADNILLPDGTPVENADGSVIHPPPAGTQPTTPYPVYHDGYDSTTKQPDPTVTIGDQSFCADGGARLYYVNLAPGLPKAPGAPGGVICINQRYHPIPPAIVKVNRAAHAAIEKYQSGTPWQYYKLVNVQARPFDTAAIDTQHPDSPHNPSTYFMANIVVETDSTLQRFNGALLATGPHSGVNTSFSATGGAAHNVYVPNAGHYQAYNMGGCMGCHGNAQVAGTDFSFILNEGPVYFPETPAATPATQHDPAKLLKYFTAPSH